MTKLASFGNVVLILSLIAIVFVVLFVAIDFIYWQVVNNSRLKKYPAITEFQEYVTDLKNRIQRESSYYYLKPFTTEIDNIYQKWSQKVPDDMLKSELKAIRALYHFRREQLAPKIITE